jgi:hypothetical protein
MKVANSAQLRPFGESNVAERGFDFGMVGSGSVGDGF